MLAIFLLAFLFPLVDIDNIATLDLDACIDNKRLGLSSRNHLLLHSSVRSLTRKFPLQPELPRLNNIKLKRTDELVL
jgi:hypothetical protein